MNSSRSRGVVFGFILCWGMPGYAQSGTPPQERPTEPLPDAPSQTREVSPAEKDEHILHIIPTVDVTDPHYPVRPLTTSQKFELFANKVFDRFTFIKAGASAGISQARDTHEGYEQGARGFGRRYGAAFAGQVHSAFFIRFAFPSLLHQDPRYFRKGQGPAGPRIGYAMSRVVVTQGDNGRRQFNFSQVLGSLFAAALANAYYPEEDRTAGRTFARAGKQVALGAGLNVLKEFGPQLRRKMFRKKTREAPAATPAPPPKQAAPGADPSQGKS
ncbi:MAG: hypothetical protein ACRD24_09385 [Terriglobales bacterium]